MTGDRSTTREWSLEGGRRGALQAMWWVLENGALAGRGSGASISVFTRRRMFLATAAVTNREAGMPTRITVRIFSRASPEIPAPQCTCLSVQGILSRLQSRAHSCTPSQLFECLGVFGWWD